MVKTEIKATKETSIKDLILSPKLAKVMVLRDIFAERQIITIFEETD